MLAGVLLLTGADVAVGRGLEASGLDFSTDLVTAVRLCILYPAAVLGVTLAVAQVAAPDLAVAVVARRVPRGPGSLRAVAALLRFRGHGVSRRAASAVWAQALLVLGAAGLATAALNSVVLD
ncbi:MAG: CPBP family intramembrane metalloprotease, partial [Actinobacteria bacterium]|nr:CPBP family intramembrane metalloprotease [Actinomycetota bacterium]